MKNLSLLILFVMLTFRVCAQDVSATADKKSILIGEQIQLDLKAEFRKAQSLQWFGIDSIPRFEILNSSKIDTQLNGDNTILAQTLILTSWDSGSWKIPAFRLGRSQTEPITIEVAFSEMDPNKPYNEIKDIIPVQRPVTSKWWWYVIFGAVLIGLFFLFFPASKTKIAKEEPEPLNAYEDAITRLDKLALNDPLDHKGFHTALVQIFRQYLYRKKNIQSFSKTTDDLAIQIMSLELPAENYTKLVQTLQLSDMVKFAKYLPQPEENETALKIIRENIDSIEKVSHAV